MYSPADYADHAEECSKLHYHAEKDRLELVWFGVLLFCCSSAIICGISGRYWGFIYANRLSTLACYSPADGAEDAEECSKLHYFAEKDRLVRLMLFCGFGFCLRKSAGSAEDIVGSYMLIG